MIADCIPLMPLQITLIVSIGRLRYPQRLRMSSLLVQIRSVNPMCTDTNIPVASLQGGQWPCGANEKELFQTQGEDRALTPVNSGGFEEKHASLWDSYEDLLSSPVSPPCYCPLAPSETPAVPCICWTCCAVLEGVVRDEGYHHPSFKAAIYVVPQVLVRFSSWSSCMLDDAFI